MKRLVFFPSDPIKAYIEKGHTYDFLDNYYNPGGFFDEVYCLSPWGDKDYETIGEIHYIKAKPEHFSKIIKRIKPDVVRGYGGYCCADWVSISKVKGIPTVVSVHDKRPEMIYDSLEYADALFCTTKAVLNAVKNKIHFNSNNMWILPNRIEPDLFKYKYEATFFEALNKKYGKGKHILHIGRKSEEKNLDTVIKSLRYLDENISLIAVGQGDPSKYIDLAKNENMLNRCYFLDRIEYTQMPLWYSWCDCFCVPSKSEGFGCVFIEAAACEALVITSNIGPMNEYLTNRENSILVDDFENPKEIAKAIEFSLADENKNLIEEMKKNARKVGLAFSKEKIDAQEIALYERAMSLIANNLVNAQLLHDMRMNGRKQAIGRYKQKLKNMIKKSCHIITNLLGISK